MTELEEQSKLYKEILEEYNSDNTSYEVFNKCVEIAIEHGHREIKYLLFKLKFIYGDTEEKNMSKFKNIADCCMAIIGRNHQIAFVISVLETALEEL